MSYLSFFQLFNDFFLKNGAKFDTFSLIFEIQPPLLIRFSDAEIPIVQHELFYNILTRITTKANRNKKGLNKSTGKKIINLRSKDDQNCHCQVHSMQKVHSSKMKLQQIAKPTKFGLFHLLLISFSWFWAFHLLLILLCLQFVNADIQGMY